MADRTRQDRWVFGDRDTGAYLAKFAWTKIVRHVPVHGWASPDDPALARYWADRRRKRVPPPADQHTVRLLRAQDGRCPACGEPLLPAGHEPRNPAEWEQWFITARQVLRKQYGTVQSAGQERTVWRLLHATCRWQLTTTAGHRQ
jgi:RNA-directed DNA polymerase